MIWRGGCKKLFAGGRVDLWSGGGGEGGYITGKGENWKGVEKK